MKRLIAVLLVLLVLPGCGTMANLDGKSDFYSVWSAADPTPRFYGGVQNDIRWIEQSYEDPSVIAFGIFGIDAVASTVGDTLTLPVVAIRQLNVE